MPSSSTTKGKRSAPKRNAETTKAKKAKKTKQVKQTKKESLDRGINIPEKRLDRGINIPEKRKSGQELTEEQLALLASIGCDVGDLPEKAADAYFVFKNMLDEKPGVTDDMTTFDRTLSNILELSPELIDDQIELLNYITESVTPFLESTPRFNWGSWLTTDERYRAFCAIWVMVLTPAKTDEKVEPVVRNMINVNPKITGPESMLKAYQCENYAKTVEKLAKDLMPIGGTQVKMASFLIQIAMICLLHGEVPSSYYSLTCLPGVGPKVADVVMFEVSRQQTFHFNHCQSLVSSRHSLFPIICYLFLSRLMARSQESPVTPT